MICGVVIFIVGTFLLHTHNFYIMFFAMLVICFGNFLSHTCGSGYINLINLNHKGIANGLYVSFYYLGGSIGSFLPGFIYTNSGWGGFLFFMSFGIVVLSIRLLLLLSCVWHQENRCDRKCSSCGNSCSLIFLLVCSGREHICGQR